MEDKPAKNNEFVIYYAIGIFILVIGVLSLLPKWEKVSPSVEIMDTQVLQKMEDGVVVGMTVRWAAPWTGSCFLANDVRPAGAQLGIPETEEWGRNHLIRYRAENNQLWTEYWINTEILGEKQNTKTFAYKLSPGSKDVKSLDFYTDLKCDDDLLASAKRLGVAV